jgi:ligand-binding SRPBCC domain-containing protein
VRFFRRTKMPASAEEVYAFHEGPDALARLIPPWERVRILLPPASLAAGTRVVLRQWLGPIPVRVEAVHDACQPGRSFVDRMVKGPFESWVHEHSFEPVDGASSWLVDDVEYTLPLEPMSQLVAGLIERRVARMFAWRHQVTYEAMTAKRQERGAA